MVVLIVEVVGTVWKLSVLRNRKIRTGSRRSLLRALRGGRNHRKVDGEWKGRGRGRWRRGGGVILLATPPFEVAGSVRRLSVFPLSKNWNWRTTSTPSGTLGLEEITGKWWMMLFARSTVYMENFNKNYLIIIIM
jgi:hypothetical protein